MSCVTGCPLFYSHLIINEMEDSGIPEAAQLSHLSRLHLNMAMAKIDLEVTKIRADRYHSVLQALLGENTDAPDNGLPTGSIPPASQFASAVCSLTLSQVPPRSDILR